MPVGTSPFSGILNGQAREPLHRVNLRLFVAVQLLALLCLAACARLGSPEGWPAGVVVEDTLYIGTMEGDFRALDIETGNSRCTFQLESENEQDRAFYGTPAIDEDTLYIGGYDGVLYALPLSCEDREKWEPGDQLVVGAGDHIVGGPTVADGAVLIGSSDGNLYAFDINRDETGVRFEGSRWVAPFPTGNKIWSTPAVADGVVYFGSLDHNLYAVSLESGEAVWPSPFSARGAITASPVVAGGRVYVGAFDSVFYAIDAKTGKEVARFEGASGWFWGAAVATEDTVFAPSLDGNLYALDIDTLEMQWSQPLKTDGRLIGSPAILGDKIAVASLDGRVRLVRLSDGSEERQCNVGVKLRASLLAHQGVIYLAASDHSVRALEVDSRGDPDEKWAHFTNEDVPVNSGRAPDC